MGFVREPWLARWGRRCLTIPTVFGLCLAMLTFAPLWVPAGWIADRARPGRAALGVLAMAQAYLLCEVAGIFASGWIGLTGPARRGAIDDARRRSAP